MINVKSGWWYIVIIIVNNIVEYIIFDNILFFVFFNVILNLFCLLIFFVVMLWIEMVKDCVFEFFDILLIIGINVVSSVIFFNVFLNFFKIVVVIIFKNVKIINYGKCFNVVLMIELLVELIFDILVKWE